MILRNTLLTAVLVTIGQHAAAQSLFTGSSHMRGDAMAGYATYTQSCLACHGPRLEGSPFAPALAGSSFQDHWRGKQAAQLLAQMRKTMPPRGTGSVRSDAFPDLLAFLVRANVEGPAFFAKLPNTAATSITAKASVRTAPMPARLARRLNGLAAVTDATLAAPADGDWLAWRRTLDAAGYSPLRQIDRRTVRRLRKVWSLPLDPSGNEITPLVYDGILFVHSGASLTAVDAESGTPLWKYEREVTRPSTASRQFDPSRRARVKSIAIYGHALYMPTPDGHLVALDARNGKLLWDRAINAGAASTGLQLSSGPLAARGVVMIGVSLGLSNKGGCFIVALDAHTGAERWRLQTVARPGTPGGDSWNDAPVEERYGAGVWTTGSYDPALNLAYFGVGNTYTTATLLQPRAGAQAVTANDGLFTDATLALRPETGELVWHHQHHRRDVWDQDWAFEQTIMTLGNGPTARRAVITAGKTAVFEAVDAATGTFLFAHDTGLSNLYASINPVTGAKVNNPQLEPVPGKPLLLCPSNLGARNWPATSLRPDTGLLFVPLQESCADFTWQPRGAQETALGGSDIRFTPRLRPGSDGKLGRMIALDLNSGRVVWMHRQRMPLASSLLATAGGVLFMADVNRHFGAYDQDNGAQLWSTELPAAAESTPITFTAGSRQFIAVVSGEGSHLGNYNRGLVPELGDPVADVSLQVFALSGT